MKEKTALDSSQSGAMRLVSKDVRLTRRGFIKGSGLASIGVTVMTAGALLTAPAAALAESFPTLGSETGKVLLLMARDIFPHDKLAEKYYMHAIWPYDGAASKDAALKTLLSDGIALLNARAQQMYRKDYAAIPTELERVAVLKNIESSAFFQKIRGGLVTGLYNNSALFSQFGYEGSSWEKGGYVNRGFDDIDWL